MFHEDQAAVYILRQLQQLYDESPPSDVYKRQDYASEVSSYTKGLGIFMVKPCGYQITKDGYSDNIRMNEKDKLLFMFQKSMSLK